MRPLKQLLEILKEGVKDRQLNNEFFFLCTTVERIYGFKKITWDEKTHLLTYLKQNKPSYVVTSKPWFEPNDFKSRINWLNEQINKL